MKIFFGISSFQVLAMFRRGLFYSYLTIYLRHFLGLSVTATSLFATLPMILNVLSQRYLWGTLSDRTQKRRSLIIYGEILGGIGTILLWAAHLAPEQKTMAGWVIIIGLSIIEIFWSMSNIGWSALISDIYPANNRGNIMGKLESLGGVGRIVGILAGGLLYDKLGFSYDGWGFYRGALFFVSSGAMFVSVFFMFLVPEGGISKEEMAAGTTGSAKQDIPFLFIIFVCAMSLIHFGRNSNAVTLAQYLTLPSGFDLSALNLSHVSNLRSIGIIIAGIFTGLLARKTGTRSLLAWASAVTIISFVILGISDSLFFVCLGTFLLGCVEAITIATAYELASLYIPAHSRGYLFSIYNATLFLSWGFAGTFISGPIIDILVNRGYAQPFAYRVSFYAAALLTMAGLLLLIWLYYKEKTMPRTAA